MQKNRTTQKHKKRKKQRTLKQTVPADGKLSYKEKKEREKEKKLYWCICSIKQDLDIYGFTGPLG